MKGGQLKPFVGVSPFTPQILKSTSCLSSPSYHAALSERDIATPYSPRSILCSSSLSQFPEYFNHSTMDEDQSQTNKMRHKSSSRVFFFLFTWCTFSPDSLEAQSSSSWEDNLTMMLARPRAFILSNCKTSAQLTVFRQVSVDFNSLSRPRVVSIHYIQGFPFNCISLDC